MWVRAASVSFCHPQYPCNKLQVYMVHPQTSIPFKMFYVHAPFSVEAVCTQRRERASESHFTPYRALCSEMAQGGPNETKKKIQQNFQKDFAGCILCKCISNSLFSNIKRTKWFWSVLQIEIEKFKINVFSIILSTEF